MAVLILRDGVKLSFSLGAQRLGDRLGYAHILVNGVAERCPPPAAVQQVNEPVLVQVARASDLLVVGARPLPARYLL